jgi:hypothetical protein
LKEVVASIVRVEEQDLQETNMKQVASEAGFMFGLIFQP